MSPLVQSALKIATEAHAGQFRKDGITPYIEHPKKVREIALQDLPDFYSFLKEDIEVAALLHDVAEDTDVSEKEIASKLNVVNPNYLEAILLILNKNHHSDYLRYILTVKSTLVTKLVKIADIKHNLSCEPKPSTKEKYLLALHILQS